MLSFVYDILPSRALFGVGCVRDPRKVEARSQALYAAWLGGVSIGAVGMALHHKLCHALGGGFNLPHAETHTVILPHAAAYNAPAAPEAMPRIARVLAAGLAAEGLYDLAFSLGAPISLEAVGMKTADLGASLVAASTSLIKLSPFTTSCPPVGKLRTRNL